MLRSRAGKGLKKMSELLQRDPQDPENYLLPHVQRHWWTWQQALATAIVPSWEHGARPPIVDCVNDRESEQK